MADEVLNIEWFGMWKALDYEIAGKRRGTNIPTGDLERQRDTFMAETKAEIKSRAEAILSA